MLNIISPVLRNEIYQKDSTSHSKNVLITEYRSKLRDNYRNPVNLRTWTWEKTVQRSCVVAMATCTHRHASTLTTHSTTFRKWPSSMIWRGNYCFSVIVVSVVESLLCPFPGIRFQTFQMKIWYQNRLAWWQLKVFRQAYLNLVAPLFILHVLTGSIQIQLIPINVNGMKNMERSDDFTFLIILLNKLFCKFHFFCFGKILSISWIYWKC